MLDETTIWSELDIKKSEPLVCISRVIYRFKKLTQTEYTRYKVNIQQLLTEVL